MRTVGAETVYWLRSRLRWGAEVSKNQDALVAKAKKAIGQPEGLAVLMVFFCERATGLCSDVGLQDEGCFEGLVRRVRQALKAIDALPTENRPPLLGRLDVVRRLGQNLGDGVGDNMDDLLAKHGFDGGPR